MANKLDTVFYAGHEKIRSFFKRKKKKKIKKKILFKNLRKEVETGANGTQDYIIKEGINKGKKPHVT